MNARMITVAVLFGFLAAAQAAPGFVEGSDDPVELGLVSWQNDLDAALDDSASSGRPVLLLFQEIPG